MKAMTSGELLQALRTADAPIVICGAGIVGEVLLARCREEGVSVAAFCDSSEKVAGRQVAGLEVVHTPELPTRYPRAVVLISVAAIKDAVDKLQGLGFDTWYAGGLLLKALDVKQGEGGMPIDYAKFAVENCILCHDGYLHPDRLFLRSVDVIITERCSLKCRDCSNLMQYYANPRHCDLSLVLRSLDALFAIAAEIMDVRVIGGDAFMNRDWTALVAKLADEDRARRVVLYTNGTIVPPAADLPVLRQKKVLVIVTDYGPLSHKLAELQRVFRGYGIAYHVLKVDDWLDCATIAQHGRPVAANRELYRNCCAKNMLTLSDGKLFRCPYAANAARLAAVPDFPDDYVDLLAEPLDQEPVRDKVRQRVHDYLHTLDYLRTCDYCNGRPLAGKEVPPAIQVDKPLPYKKYTR
jgi:hypothetical protein